MKRSEALFLLISVSILVFAWIVFNIHHSSITSTIPEDVNKQIVPLNPQFDTKTLGELKKRNKVTPILESLGTTIEMPSTKEASLKPSISPTVSFSSPSASQGTQGGILR